MDDEQGDEIDDTSPADISSNNTSDDLLAKKKLNQQYQEFII